MRVSVISSRIATITRGRPQIVLATVPSDSHAWNLVFMQLLLTEIGFDVINLGPCTPVALVLDTAAELGADGIVISTINGHGCDEAPRLGKAKIADPRVSHLPLAVGGKLTTTNRIEPDQVERLRASGFGLIHQDNGSPLGLKDDLHTFLAVTPIQVPRGPLTSPWVAHGH